MATCNHPIGSVACVLEAGHEGEHQADQQPDDGQGQWRKVKGRPLYDWADSTYALPEEVCYLEVSDDSAAYKAFGPKRFQLPEEVINAIIADHTTAAQVHSIQHQEIAAAQVEFNAMRDRAIRAEDERDEWERLARDRGKESEASRFIGEAAAALKKYPEMDALARVTQLEAQVSGLLAALRRWTPCSINPRTEYCYTHGENRCTIATALAQAEATQQAGG